MNIFKKISLSINRIDNEKTYNICEDIKKENPDQIEFSFPTDKSRNFYKFVTITKDGEVKVKVVQQRKETW